jgi:phosphoglycerate dehydrogenase-like enzyme
MKTAAMTHDLVPADADHVVLIDPVTLKVEGDLGAVGFYVPPYMGRIETLQLMSGLPSLEVVQLLTIGYDAALPLCPPGVTMCNAVGVHEASTAELAIGLMLASLRGIDRFARAMPEGSWQHERLPTLADRRVLVIGAGGVGMAIVDRLRPFEVQVTVVARRARPGVVPVTDLDRLLPQSDVVVVAVPLSPETERLVDAGFLASMPDGALLVNVARGLVVDTDSLLREVSSGRLRAALDVTDPEPLPADHPLWRAPGVLISPHVGGDASAFLPRARELVADQLARWRHGRQLRNVVT